ncbi:MAG: PaaI family thioesterase [Bacteroidetes bacterium]|jgi:acyl-coenzyme A thioesterase PaaI-like protein|nr:PaaI family thioesterase [Bacteroidota bacterium]
MSTFTAPAVQDDYPDDVAHCYGCGRLNADGIQLKSREDGEETVAYYTPRAEHTSVPGFVYGGLIASLIDCHSMATAAIAVLKRDGRRVGDGLAPRFVTGALNVQYLKPTPIGVELEVRGRVKEMGERKCIVEATLSADGVITARGDVVAVRMPDSMARPGS